MPMFRFWLSQLTIKQKLQSIYGTARRVFSKRLRRRHPVVPFVPPQALRPAGWTDCPSEPSRSCGELEPASATTTTAV
jgi:hypothetical protein